MWAVGSACCFFIFSLYDELFGLVFGTLAAVIFGVSLWKEGRP